MKKLALILIILLIPSLCLASWNAYIVNGSTKYRPWDGISTDTSLSINAVKGQWAVCQIGLVTTEAVTGISVSATTPTKGSDTLNAPYIYREAWMNVFHPSRYNYGWQGETPDILIPKVDSYVGESRNAFTSTQGRDPTIITDLNHDIVGPCYPVYGVNLHGGLSTTVSRTNTAKTLPYITGTFSGSGQTNYHIKIDSAGGRGTAKFKWTDHAAHIKYLTRSGSTVTIHTYSAHGFNNGDSVYVESASGGTYNPNGTFTISNATSDSFQYTSSGGTLYSGTAGGGGYCVDITSANWDGTSVTTGASVSLNNGLSIVFPDQTYAVDDEWEFYANTSRTMMVFVESFIPSTSPFGTYTSTITVSASGKSNQDLTWSIDVKNITIPATSSIPVIYRGSNESITEGHWGVGTDLTTATKVALGMKYMEAGLKHRTTVSYIGPWLTWNGTSIGNWDGTNKMNEFIGPYMKGTWSGATKYGSMSGWVLPYAALGFLFTPIVASGSSTPREADLTQSEKDFLGVFATQTDVSTYLTSPTIWIPIVEEPPYPISDANKNAAIAAYTSIKAKDSRYFIQIEKYKSADLVGYTDQWCENIKSFGAHPASEIGAGEGRLIMYFGCDSKGCNCIGGSSTYEIYPNQSMDCSLAEMRAYPWLTFSSDANGLYYYAIMENFQLYTQTLSYPVDPWDLSTGYGGYGEGSFFYPGRASTGSYTPCAIIGGSTDIPVESLRLKAFRAGLEDFELFKLSNIAYAKSQIETVSAIGANKSYYNPAYYSSMAAQMETARTNILDNFGSQAPFSLGISSGGATFR